MFDLTKEPIFLVKIGSFYPILQLNSVYGIIKAVSCWTQQPADF